MLFLKPFIRTIILATILFFLLVYLGMKYHWVENFNSKTNKIALSIPDQSALMGEFDNVKLEGDSKGFQPSLIQRKEPKVSAQLADMTKRQVVKHCQQLFRKTAMDRGLRELVVVDCVVSLYREKSLLGTTQNRQIKIKR